MNNLQYLNSILSLFFATHKRALLVGIASATATVIAGIALLGLSGWFITATAIAGLSIASAMVFDVFMPAAGIRFLAIFRTGARYVERLITHNTTLLILAALRERLFRSWAKPAIADLLLKRPARLLFRLTLDIDALDTLYLRVIVPLGAALATVLLLAIALGLMHPVFGISAAGLLLLVGIGLPLLASFRAEKPMRRRAKGTEALRARVIDMVAGQTDLIMAGRMPAQIKAVQRADDYIASSDRTLNRIEILTGTGLGILHAALLSGGLVVAGLLVYSGNISAPVAALALLIILGAIEPFMALRRGAIELGRTIIAARRIVPQLEQPDKTIELQPPIEGLAIRLKGVKVRHQGAPAYALDDVSLDIKPGERVAIIGTSGAGKSTLLNVLAGEIEVEHGIVQTLPIRLMTQRTELFHDNLRNNLGFANPNSSDSDLVKALYNAGLKEFFEKQPEGLNSNLGEGGLGLSGGQARRLALARLFITDVPVWLLDEPTEGLDSLTAEDVTSRLESLAQGRTLLIATHIQREARLCDRIIILEQGKIVDTVYKTEHRFKDILAALR